DGTAVITAASDGASATSTMFVSTPAIATVAVSPASSSLVLGQPPVQLTATLKDANGNELTGRSVAWKSSSAIVTVSSTGLATAIGTGTATITATSGGKLGNSTITVSAGSLDPAQSSFSL